MNTVAVTAVLTVDADDDSNDGRMLCHCQSYATSIVNRCWSGFPCKWRYI